MKRIICLLLVCSIVYNASAQDTYNSSGRAGGYKRQQQKGYDPDKLVLGGGFNLGYAGDYINLGISPKVGYKLKSYLAAGVGLGYQYYRAYDFTYDNKIYYVHENIITPSIWAKCFVYNPFFLSTDVELNLIGLRGSKPAIDPVTYQYYITGDKINVSAVSWLVGPGLRQSMGGRFSGTLEILYDVLQADYSPYKQQLVWRASIYVGL